MALEQEKRVGEEIYALFALAREIEDYRAEQFMQWFVKEQVEEVALMQDLLNVVERSEENLLLAEEYIAREALGEATTLAKRAEGGGPDGGPARSEGSASDEGPRPPSQASRRVCASA